MCGRYYVSDEDSAADLREIIEQINRRANAGPVVKTGEIAPSDVAPVLAGAGEQSQSGRDALCHAVGLQAGQWKAALQRPKRDGGCEGALSGRYAASSVPCARGALFRVGKAR